MSTKMELIQDIQDLLNSNQTVSLTEINPNLLEFMDKETLKNIIGSLLDQIELESSTVDLEWLHQFKSDNN